MIGGYDILFCLAGKISLGGGGRGQTAQGPSVDPQCSASCDLLISTQGGLWAWAQAPSVQPTRHRGSMEPEFLCDFGQLPLPV